MQNKVSRIIIDTNLWISFLITKDFTKLDEIIFSRNGILIFGQELLDEFLEIARRQNSGVSSHLLTLKKFLKP